MIRVLLIAWGLMFFCVPAAPAQTEVAPDLVCRVQNAIRWHKPAWPSQKCETVAASLNVTAQPLVLAAICLNESDWNEEVIAWHGRHVADVGSCGVRCHLGKHRRCTNGAARGLTIAQLQDAETNIAVAAAILAGKPGIGEYNSATPAIRDAYERKIAVLVSALSGEHVDRRRIHGKRLRKLVKQIEAALAVRPNT